MIDWKPKLLVVEEASFQNLLKLAEELYGKCEQETRELLRSKGHTRWDPAKWWDYLAHFRVCWGKTLKEQAEEQRYEKLLELEKGACCVFENGFWKWEGVPEAIAAHWELEELRREKRRREFMRRRLQPL